MLISCVFISMPGGNKVSFWERLLSSFLSIMFLFCLRVKGLACHADFPDVSCPWGWFALGVHSHSELIWTGVGGRSCVIYPAAGGVRHHFCLVLWPRTNLLLQNTSSLGFKGQWKEYGSKESGILAIVKCLRPKRRKNQLNSLHKHLWLSKAFLDFIYMIFQLCYFLFNMSSFPKDVVLVRLVCW